MYLGYSLMRSLAAPIRSLAAPMFFGGSDAFFGGPDILEMPEHPLTTTLSPLSLRRSWRPAPRSLAFPLFLALLLGWTGPGALWAQDGPLDPREMELRPGDVIRIQVWRQPELSGEFFITADDGASATPCTAPSSPWPGR
jgi:hypothetical protein